jgi:recombination protein RecA
MGEAMTPSKTALEKFEKLMAKRYGEGRLETADTIQPYEVISTGSLALDLKTAVGGLVEGRLHEWWGVDNIGKTTLAILALCEAQKKHPDKLVAVIDVEHTFDDRWAARLGLNISRGAYYKFRPNTAEEASDALGDMVRGTLVPGIQFSMVLLDTVAAMIPKREMEKLSEEEVVGTQAKIVTRLTKKNSVWADQSKVCVLLLNQVRANISAYGRDKQTGGGWALKHGSTMKMEFSRTGLAPYKTSTGADGEVVGHEVSVHIDRNKVGPSKRTAQVSLFFVESDKFGPIGVDKADEAARIGKDTGIVQQHGGWYYLREGTDDEIKFNGLDKVTDYFRENPEVLAEVREQVLATVAGAVVEDDIAKGEFDPGEEGDDEAA